MNQRIISLLGLIVFVGIGYLFSVNRQAIRWATVLWGIGLQLVLAVLILKTTIGLTIFQFLGDRTKELLDFSDAGAKFIFGDGFEEHFIAFKVLPTIIFFSAFIAPSGQGVRSQEPVVRINLIIKQFFLLIPSLPNRV